MVESTHAPSCTADVPNQRRASVRKSSRLSTAGFLLLAASPLVMFPSSVTCFAPWQNLRQKQSSLTLTATIDPDDEISRQVARAKILLAKTKEKMEAAEVAEERPKVGNVPFFASADRSPKKEKVIKTQNKETGLITTDGDLMATLSEEEEWEPRPLLEVFRDENEVSLVAQGLAQRDVAASIYNLRKTLQNDDFMKIFNKKNYFIGEE
jgi:hypothetical protein